jgi:uncharacterized membrane protein YfcA
MDVVTITVVVVVMTVTFFVNAVTGFGAAVLGMPFLVHVVSVQDAVAYYAILFLIFSAYMAVRYWRGAALRMVAALSVSATVGLYVGVQLLTSLSGVVLEAGLGVLTLGYVAFEFVDTEQLPLSSFRSIFGLVGGVFSGAFSTGGPPIVAYVHNELGDADTIRASLITTFAVMNVARIPMLVGADVLTVSHVISMAYVVPFFVVAVYAGDAWYGSIEDGTFDALMLTVLGIAGVSLLIP